MQNTMPQTGDGARWSHIKGRGGEGARTDKDEVLVLGAESGGDKEEMMVFSITITLLIKRWKQASIGLWMI